ANEFSNSAQVVKYGGRPLMLGIARDNISELTAKIKDGLAQGADLLLTSGGVSVGDFDVVKQVLMAEGEMTFWRVRMKPGKPLAFGMISTKVDGKKRSVPVLGMPGNPVSAMISFEIFVRAALLKMSGYSDTAIPTFEAILDDPITQKDDRRHYVRAMITHKQGNYHASLTGDQGSGILNSMVQANGLVIISEDLGSVEAGKLVPAIWLD
ncbi:MAG: molybdopterin molybdotransferase MoeA, partial [Anaerolineae bacterium]|nr:molybdopterin molybdotransferase MoeA [Anaerolineae bacterium]